jgi:signal transduction histidine kinase
MLEASPEARLRTGSIASDRDALGRADRAWRLLVGHPDARAGLRYGIALGIALAAVAVVVTLHGETGGFRVMLYASAVALATLRGGAGPGLLVVAVCAVAFVVDDPASEWLEQPTPIHRLLLFVSFAALTVWGTGAMRDGLRQAQLRRRRAEARADAQRIAAELGVRALAEGNLDALLADTVAAVQRALRCDRVTLLELRPEGHLVPLRDTPGGAGARAALGPAEAPLAFHALAAREPVVGEEELGVASSLMAPVAAEGPAGRSFGVLGAHSLTARTFTADEAAFLQTAANVVGTAVVRIRAEERARRTLESERFLAEASRQLALSIDWQQTVTRIARLALPFLGDWCLVVVVDPNGRPRTVIAETVQEERSAAVQDLLERYPIDLEAKHGVGRIVRTGEPELLPEVDPETFVTETNRESELRLEVLRRLGVVSYLAAPLRAGGRILGAIGFGIASGARRFGPEDLEIAQTLAQQCAAALDNAGLYRAAQEATRAREEVLAVVSHDLKTPLGALLMGAHMVERLAAPGSPGDELRRAATVVRRSADRMQRLIHDLVDVASMEAGRLSVQPAPQDAAALAREAVDAVQALAEDRGVVVAFEPADVPAVECDRDRVLQVLSNLLSNAIQVCEPGSRVAVSLASTGEEVVFKVADEGPGIPADDLPHLFDRWYRGQASRYPGSGLGLAIARSIVSAQGGSIWAESREGGGATFAFALPRSFGASAATG